MLSIYKNRYINIPIFSLKFSDQPTVMWTDYKKLFLIMNIN